MREILFRGKRLSDGKMVYGESINTQYDAEGKKRVYVGALFSSYIYPLMKCVEWHEVDPTTVGQYTWLTDKNDKNIFEGDIVRDKDGKVYVVLWSFAGFGLKYNPLHAHGFYYELVPMLNFWNAHGATIEVIGNIHDNPDLLNKEG